jgi:uncharacterized membrane protein
MMVWVVLAFVALYAAATFMIRSFWRWTFGSIGLMTIVSFDFSIANLVYM